MTDQTDETTELDIYRPHLAELGRQDAPSEIESMLQEARSQSADIIMGQCSLGIEVKGRWTQEIEDITSEMNSYFTSTR